MSKITERHLSRAAYVYVRQSSRDQVEHNLESQRRQYGLEAKARELGWKETVVLDTDQGKSSSGSVVREGFEQLVAQVCQDSVGAIFVVEASRLARNGREWHTLLEVCGMTQTLIIDHDGVYDPKHPNDRLVLGMKGIVSEMELAVMIQRSQEALKLKAGRGELFFSVAVGYVRVGGDRIEKDPDLRIQAAIGAIFEQFHRLGSVRQVLLWCRQERLPLPSVVYGPEGRSIEWKLPVYSTLHNLLTNPIYAGTYAFGRTYTKTTLVGGRKRTIQVGRREQRQWPVLIPNHHEGYISWEQYQGIQQMIAQNANMKGLMARGSVRRGEALLAGLLRCGHCGRKLHVSYGGNCLRYGCRGAAVNHGEERCIGFGGIRIDTAVSEAVLEVLSPMGVSAALEAIRSVEQKHAEVRRQKELAVQQAGYEAERAKRQYDRVEPENRLVAAELERRWNDALEQLRVLDEELRAIPRADRLLDEAEKAELLSLGRDLRLVWEHPCSSPELKKRIIRAVIREIIVNCEGQMISLIIHWEGGDHSSLSVRRNTAGSHRWTTDVETERIIRELARVSSDESIASLLNRLGKRTAKGNSWTQARVASVRNARGIPVHEHGEMAARGEMLAAEAAQRLGVTTEKLYKLIRKGVVKATRVCFAAPWVIRTEALEDPQVVKACRVRLADAAGPVTAGQPELSLDSTTT